MRHMWRSKNPSLALTVRGLLAAFLVELVGIELSTRSENRQVIDSR
jgi:hypothetical protein